MKNENRKPKTENRRPKTEHRKSKTEKQLAKCEGGKPEIKKVRWLTSDFRSLYV